MPIYSLTDSTNRHAKIVLEKISTSVAVEINVDHGGTNHLRLMAENSDIFVQNHLSVKHAAADFIRTHHGATPLFHSQGKGFSSIIIILIRDFLNFKNFS